MPSEHPVAARASGSTSTMVGRRCHDGRRCGPDRRAPDVPAPVGTRRPRYGMPRALIIIVGLAAWSCASPGMRAIPGIIGPVFMALVLTITVNPIRGWMIRHGASRGVASLAVFLAVTRDRGRAVRGRHRGHRPAGQPDAAVLRPDPAATRAGSSWLAGMGISQANIQAIFSNVEPSQLAAFAQDLLSSISGIFSFLLFMIVVLIFLAVDATVFDQRMARVRAGSGAGARRAWVSSPGAPASTSGWPPSSVASSR